MLYMCDFGRVGYRKSWCRKSCLLYWGAVTRVVLLRVRDDFRVHVFWDLVREADRHVDDPPCLQTRQVPQDLVWAGQG